jgi:hypothetical protein
MPFQKGETRSEPQKNKEIKTATVNAASHSATFFFYRLFQRHPRKQGFGWGLGKRKSTLKKKGRDKHVNLAPGSSAAKRQKVRPSLLGTSHLLACLHSCSSRARPILSWDSTTPSISSHLGAASSFFIFSAACANVRPHLRHRRRYRPLSLSFSLVDISLFRSIARA